MSYEYKCEKCGQYHRGKGSSSFFYLLKEKRRATKAEVNKYGLKSFGKDYAFAKYCPITKEYTILKGFVT